MANLTPSPEIKKLLKVEQFWLNRTGLELLYTFKGKEFFKTFNQWQTASLMHRADLIDDYRRVMGEIQLAFSYDCDGENCRADVQDFESFVMNMRFSQYDALCIAVLCVWDEELEAVKQHAKTLNEGLCL